MAGDSRSLTVKWFGDASNLVKSTKTAASAVGNAGKEISGHGSKMAGIFGQLGKVLGAFNLPFSGAAKGVTSELGQLEAAGLSTGGAMSAGFGVAGAAAVAFAKESVDAAEEFNKAHERLGVVVENVGESMKAEGGRIDNADAKLAALGFTTTDTESAMAKLVPVTKDVGKATQLLNLAADISRARNISLEEATSLLVAVEGGRLKGLAKLGIAQKDATGHTLTAAEAVVKLNQAYGGAAAQYAETYAGHIAVLKSEVNSLKVTLGNQLIPELSNLAGTFGVGLSALNSFTQATHISAGRIAADVLSFGLNELAQKGLSEVHHTGDAAAKTMREYAAAQRAVADDVANGTTKTADGVKHQKDLNEAQSKAKAINDALAMAASGESDATKQATQAAKDSKKATDEARKAAEQREKALRDETDAILGTRDADIALDNANLGVSDSLDTYSEKAKAASQWGGKNAAANREWEKASNDVKGSIDNVASSADNAAQKEAILKNHTYDARDSAKAQEAALIKMRDTIKPGNPFRSYLDQLIAQLDAVARPRHGSVAMTVTANGVPVRVGTTGSAGITTGGYGVPLLSRAEGGYIPGPIGAPVPAIVHGGEYVTRAQDVGRGNGGGGNSYTINVHVSPGADPANTGKAVVEAIRAYERRNGASWRAA